ncbi:MAG: hypothetical protein ABR981_01270 [Candidatus Micrarchaeaceae archaeon]|jgi:hypothetical protein
MIDADKLVDKFSGFITKEQAEKILKSEANDAPRPVKKAPTTINVKELLNNIKAGMNANRMLDDAKDADETINIKDQIYRIFNSTTNTVNGKDITRRYIILGEEGSTVRFNLKGNASEFIDINGFERGDVVAVSNAIFDNSSAELKSTVHTVINKITPSKRVPITDYSSIKEDLRKVDVIGRVLEIGTIRHVTRLGSTGQIAVASCTITDGRNSVDASFWGSSAIRTASMKTNDFIKIEFCDVRVREGKLQIYANDSSRIATGKVFAGRIANK